MRPTAINLQRAAFIIALVLFAFVGAYVLSSCQSYQPLGEGLWRAL